MLAKSVAPKENFVLLVRIADAIRERHPTHPNCVQAKEVEDFYRRRSADTQAGHRSRSETIQPLDCALRIAEAAAERAGE